jgi:hypothetical protein
MNYMIKEQGTGKYLESKKIFKAEVLQQTSIKIFYESRITEK